MHMCYLLNIHEYAIELAIGGHLINAFLSVCGVFYLVATKDQPLGQEHTIDIVILVQ
jgi:hypothetical protein